MHRLHQSVYGREHITDNTQFLARIQQRDTSVQYYGDHRHDLPPHARMNGPINADPRRSYKAVQETAGFVQGTIDAVARGQATPTALVRSLDAGPSLHQQMVDEGQRRPTIRDRRVPAAPESYAHTHRKY